MLTFQQFFSKLAFPEWKEKLVRLGSDGAPVMVGKRGGGGGELSTLLREEVPHLINIQFLGHGLELAAMDAINRDDRMKKYLCVNLFQNNDCATQ